MEEVKAVAGHNYALFYLEPVRATEVSRLGLKVATHGSTIGAREPNFLYSPCKPGLSQRVTARRIYER